MIEFSTCCSCVPLRTGCLILGYLDTIVSIILEVVIMVGVGKVAAPKTVDERAIVAVYVIVLIVVTVQLTLSILFVVGIHKGRRSFVKAYLIYYLIYIILYVIAFILRCGTLPPDPSVIIGVVVATLVQILVNVYFLLVIRSYWVTMGDNFSSA